MVLVIGVSAVGRSRINRQKVQKRWKGIRDKYVRELKKINGGQSGDAGLGYVSCWSLYKMLGFLKDTVKHKVNY